MDWQTWHGGYDEPGSTLARRLEAVQAQIRSALDGGPPGPLNVISMCAGQGRDLLGVLTDHPRRDDVRARLVELDPRSSARAEADARAAGLDRVEVVTADASELDRYQGMVPAALVLACGVFGNITDEDVERTIDACTRLCGTGGTVIWTRHRGAPDLVPQICEWFEERGFVRLWVSDPGEDYGVGAHRFTGETRPLMPGLRMFTFVNTRARKKAETRAADRDDDSAVDRDDHGRDDQGKVGT